MQIDFKHFTIYTNISHTECEIRDIRQPLADMLYKSGAGIEALDMGLAIYKSEQGVELTEQDMCTILQIVERHGTAMLIGSMRTAFGKDKD